VYVYVVLPSRAYHVDESMSFKCATLATAQGIVDFWGNQWVIEVRRDPVERERAFDVDGDDGGDGDGDGDGNVKVKME
jgi:hypothetical protein